MAVHKRGGRWSYAFLISGVRYRGAIPEARTKREAEDVESKVRHSVFEGTYGRKAQVEVGTTLFAKFVEEIFGESAKFTTNLPQRTNGGHGGRR